MIRIIIGTLFALSAAFVDSAVLRRDVDTSNFTLYVYGSDGYPSGLPVFYADGVAYIGSSAPSNASIVSSVTFAESSSDSTAWQITPRLTSNGTDSANVTGRYFAIKPDDDSSDTVRFMSNSSSNYTTTGFTFFGSYAFWVDSSGGYEASWYAQNTTEDGLYLLKWGTSAATDSVAVALRTIAPGNSASTGKE